MSAPRVTNLAVCLRRFRAMGELTTRDLAAQIGISAPTLSRLENGVGDLDGPSLWKILAWLNASITSSDKNAAATLKTQVGVPHSITTRTEYDRQT